MLKDVVQVILRNQGTQGYETIYSSTDVEIETELLHLLLPRAVTNKKNPNYFFKYPINKDFTLIKLVQDDGLDPYKRYKAKVILFIVPNDDYESVGGLEYFASPLWLQTITTEINYPLDYEKDFEKLPENESFDRGKFTTLFHELLLDKLLLYQQVILILDETENFDQNRVFLLQSLAFIDNKLPSFFRSQISIKSLANKVNYDLANCIVLQGNEEQLEISEETFILHYPLLQSEKDYEIETGELPSKMLRSKSYEELESIGATLLRSKIVQKEELVPQDSYNKLTHRFGIRDKNLFNRLFRNFNFR